MKQTYFEFWIPRNQHWGFLWFSLFRGTQHRQYSYHGNISTPVLMGLGSLGSLGSLSSLSRGGPHNGCSGCSGGTLRLRPRWCRSRRWRSRWSGASGASCCSCCSWRPRSQESWSRRSRSRRSRSARRPLMLKWKHNIKVSKVSRYINQWIKMSLFAASRDSCDSCSPQRLAIYLQLLCLKCSIPHPLNHHLQMAVCRSWLLAFVKEFVDSYVMTVLLELKFPRDEKGAIRRLAFVKASNHCNVKSSNKSLFISVWTCIKHAQCARERPQITRPLGRALRTFSLWLLIAPLKMSVQDLKAQRFCCLTTDPRRPSHRATATDRKTVATWWQLSCWAKYM